MPHYFTEFVTDDDLDAAGLNSRLTQLDTQLFNLASGSNYEVQTANRIFAGPTTGSPAAPTFRALVSDDLTGALTTPPTIGFTTPNSGIFTDLQAVTFNLAGTSPSLSIEGSSGATLLIDGGPGQVDRIALMDAGDNVWRIHKDASDDFVIERFVSAVLTDEALKIINSSGAVVVTNELQVGGSFNHDGSTLGFYGTAPVTKPTVTGDRSSGTALTDLLTKLASTGLITDSTVA